jgi:hypothetical protein
MVVLVRFPAQCEHAIADFSDDIIAAHQRLLTVALANKTARIAWAVMSRNEVYAASTA